MEAVSLYNATTIMCTCVYDYPLPEITVHTLVVVFVLNVIAVALGDWLQAWVNTVHFVCPRNNEL